MIPSNGGVQGPHASGAVAIAIPKILSTLTGKSAHHCFFAVLVWRCKKVGLYLSRIWIGLAKLADSFAAVLLAIRTFPKRTTVQI